MRSLNNISTTTSLAALSRLARSALARPSASPPLATARLASPHCVHTHSSSRQSSRVGRLVETLDRPRDVYRVIQSQYKTLVTNLLISLSFPDSTYVCHSPSPDIGLNNCRNNCTTESKIAETQLSGWSEKRHLSPAGARTTRARSCRASAEALARRVAA